MNKKFRVRVLFSYPLYGEMNFDNLSWSEASDKFQFYVAACLQFPEINVRCVNIFKHGKQKSIKHYCPDDSYIDRINSIYLQYYG